MAVSQNTVDQILTVLLMHVDKKKLKRILFHLSKIKGNKSFRDTAAMLEKRLKERDLN